MSLAASYPIAVYRTPTANGGWEWHLTVDGERVPLGRHEGVGLFTDRDDRVTPAQMLPRLLARAAVGEAARR
jgi:hypothetical protein